MPPAAGGMIPPDPRNGKIAAKPFDIGGLPSAVIQGRQTRACP